VPSPLFTIPVADLEYGPKQARFEIPSEWLQNALAETDAEPLSAGSLDVELSKNGRQVMVRGQAQVSVRMPCSRTLEPVDLDLTPEIFLMLSQASASGAKPPRAARKRKGRGKTEGAGEAKRKYRPWTDDPELTRDDVASDTFEGENVVLDSYVREFIVLDLPMFPVRSDLPTGPNAAIPPPPAVEDSGERPIDPRLAPLADIASRLRRGKS
jgi:uncharacterized protein